MFSQTENPLVIMDNNQEAAQNVSRKSKTQNIAGLGRRGHQHHVRHSGTRPSNIEADEILAALRRGDQMPITETLQQYFEPSIHHIEIDLSLDDENLLKTENSQSSYSDKNVDDTFTTPDQNNRKSSTNRKHVDYKNLMYDDDDNNDDEGDGDNVDDDDSNITLSKNLNPGISNIGTQITIADGSINNSKNSDKSKTKRSKRGDVTQSDIDLNTNRDVSRKKFKRLSPMEERPPLEGADSDYWTENSGTDIENDPEAAEWSKLRCTSERTEVIAEREYRRQNRRCADYPGLAFGRSIFSSDTMMKLNIIRNELHNIMKTQLKRVRVVRTLVQLLRSRIHVKNTRSIYLQCETYVNFFSNRPIHLSVISPHFEFSFQCSRHRPLKRNKEAKLALH